MTITVTGVAGSTCTLRVITTLNELNIPFELEPVDYTNMKSEEYLKNKHPFGKMPVLNDDGYQIFESRAIVRYLATKYQDPSHPLISSDLQKLGIQEQFISIEYSYYDPAISSLVYEQVFKKMIGKEDPDPQKVAELKKKAEEVLDVYDKLLVGKDYMTGEFSIVDILHLPFGYYAYTNGFSDLFDSRPNIKRWWSKINENAAWKKTVAGLKK